LSLKRLLEPCWVAPGSLCELPLEVFLDRGIAALVLDVDCTLVPRYSRDLPEGVVRWVHTARQHLRLHLFSNNPSKRRIEAIARSFDLPYTAAAGKPRRGPLRLVLEQLQLPSEQVALIGDRLFTDVLAGNRLGLFTVLVKPVAADGSACSHDRMQRGEKLLARWCGARVETGLPLP
jgi:HAD superfamily phosphatase (TIGR01668 family)